MAISVLKQSIPRLVSYYQTRKYIIFFDGNDFAVKAFETFDLSYGCALQIRLRLYESIMSVRVG